MNDKINVELIIKQSKKKQQTKDTLDFRELANDIIEKYPVEEYGYDEQYNEYDDEQYNEYDEEEYDEDNDDEKPTFTYLSKNE